MGVEELSDYWVTSRLRRGLRILKIAQISPIPYMVLFVITYNRADYAMPVNNFEQK